MSFVPLDDVEFSREERMEDTPVRLRAARCKSPVPESDRSRSFDGSRHQDATRMSAVDASTRVQSPPVQQPSIPRHRPIAPRSELLRTIDESVSDLHQELHQHNRSAQSMRSDVSQRSRISDICRKLDVIASVVLRHERELKEQSQFVMQPSHHVSAERSRPAYPAYSSGELSRAHDVTESSELMRSILKKVSEVNDMMEHVATNAAAPAMASRDRSFSTAREESVAVTDVSSPLVRIADALDVVTRELQRQHSTIERLARAQAARDEEERIDSVMRYNPPSDVAPSETTSTQPDEHHAELEEPADVNERFAQRMLAAGVEFDSQRRDRHGRTPTPGDRTASVHSSTISVNEASPQRVRLAAPREAAGSADSSRISVNEASPQRVRVAPAYDRTTSTISVNEASPQRARVAASRSRTDSHASSRISVNEASPQRARMAYRDPRDESVNSSRISADEASPQRVRMAAPTSNFSGCRASSRLTPDESSPRRARAASAMALYDDVNDLVTAETQRFEDDDVAQAEYYEPSEDFTSPTQRFQRASARRHGSVTVPAKTSVAGESTVLRTVTKQPEFLLRSASAQKSHSRKPVVRADIFDDDSDTTEGGSAATPHEDSLDIGHSRMTAGAQEELIRRLRHENESLKRQLHSQLVRNDEMRSVVKEAASPSRFSRSMLA